MDPRDTLWRKSFEVFYNAYYEQLLAERLMGKWYTVDLAARLLIAVTASGSAIAAWAVWQQPEYKWIWGVVAGLAALFSVVHSVLAVSQRIGELSDTREAFLLIRNELEGLRFKMSMNPQFDVEVFATEVVRLGKMYADAESRYTVDVFRSRRLQTRVQADLDLILGDENELEILDGEVETLDPETGPGAGEIGVGQGAAPSTAATQAAAEIESASDRARP